MTQKRIIAVAKRHIQPGIERYGGKVDTHLQSLVNHAGLEYKVYRFTDGRILLVLPHDLSALLYPDEQTLLKVLELEL